MGRMKWLFTPLLTIIRNFEYDNLNMATSVNKGQDLHVWNFSVGTTNTQLVLNQKVNHVQIQCRTAVDLEFYESTGSADYFLIKSGTVFTLDLNARDLKPFAIRSTSGTIVVEIVGLMQ